MTQIENYMHDGANWQAQAVLAYLRVTKNYAVSNTWDDKHKKYLADVFVGRYENCREQGYIFSVRYKGEQRNYAVYEHRNSDQLCVVVFDGATINTPTNDMLFEAMGDNKWNYTKAFGFGEIVSCGDYIVENIKEFINKVQESKK